MKLQTVYDVGKKVFLGGVGGLVISYVVGCAPPLERPSAIGVSTPSPQGKKVAYEASAQTDLFPAIGKWSENPTGIFEVHGSFGPKEKYALMIPGITTEQADEIMVNLNKAQAWTILPSPGNHELMIEAVSDYGTSLVQPLKYQGKNEKGEHVYVLNDLDLFKLPVTRSIIDTAPRERPTALATEGLAHGKYVEKKTKELYDLIPGERTPPELTVKGAVQVVTEK